MKIRITHAPHEREIDGLSLQQFRPGAVKDVSSSIGSWLITEGYAEPEMRRQPPDDDHYLSPRRDQKFEGKERRAATQPSRGDS